MLAAVSPERMVHSRRVYEGRVVALRVDEVELPSGRHAVREIVEHRGAVAIVPLRDGDVLLVRQFRTAVGRELLEIPAGTIEPGEGVEACLQRELAEEVGMRAGRFEHLLTFFPSPGFLTEAVHLYLAGDLVPHRSLDKAPINPDPFDLAQRGQRRLDAEEEDLRVVRMPLMEAKALVAKGELMDAKSIIGILLTAARGNSRG